MRGLEAKTTELEQKLGEFARQGVARANPQLLREVAETLWYSTEVPDLAYVEPALRPDAGYLVDKLARFNVLDRERKLVLLQAVRRFLAEQKTPANPACRDPLAVEWGASADLTPRLQELMPYQTRQYAADRQQQAVA